MMTDRTRAARRDPERGSAIITVLLLLLLMTGLAAALTVSGRTESLITRNHQSRAQARAAAEAGLNHAVQIAVDYLQTVDPVNIPGALDALLVDPVALAGVAFATPTAVAGAIDGATSYQVFLMDEDDPDRGAAATTLTDDADAANNEDGAELTDSNNTLVFRATGVAQGGATVTLEALIAPIQLGAIVTDGDLEITGSVDVNGANADVHSNGDLTIGGSAAVDGDMTATGEYDGPSGAGNYGGAAEKPLPNIRAADYRHHADFVLSSTGMVQSPAGITLCDPGNNGKGCEDTFGWSFDGADGWSMGNSGTARNGTFYVEGKATITANHVIQLTVIAEGSIDLSGSPELTADTNELLFVTDGDLDISGGVTTNIVAQGQMLVHEQVSISGNVSLGGQLIVEDSPSVDSTVDENQISGSVVIDYNGALGTNLFFVTGWREVR